ncbi:hypothetical protein BHM03_00009558 [Ensete ventricosum]|nr:hypothetical protein BHM03_00009558 [Ensete ventricosum]
MTVTTVPLRYGTKIRPPPLALKWSRFGAPPQALVAIPLTKGSHHHVQGGERSTAAAWIISNPDHLSPLPILFVFFVNYRGASGERAGISRDKREMKYVLVTGGVVSGLGKGVTASSIGVILKACGLRVTTIKIGACLASSNFTVIFVRFPLERNDLFYSEEVDL